MPPKKRQVSEATESESKRQKARGGQLTPQDYRDFYNTTIDVVYGLRDHDNERQLVSAFIKLPSKKLYPDYFQIIAKPITVSEIQKNASRGKYSTENTDDFLRDFKQLYDNASTYNDPESWIVSDAKQILDFVTEQVEQFAPAQKHENEKEQNSQDGSRELSSRISPDEVPQLAKDVLEDVINHPFPELGVLSEPFMEIVDRKEYPDYFKVIQKPTSFNSVLQSIDNRTLFPQSRSMAEELQAFHDETDLIFQNAQTYNDPGSLIYQDSAKLREYFNEKFAELKSKLDGHGEESTGKLKLKLKTRPKKESTPKVKINLKLKPSENSESAQDSRKKSRKKRPDTPVKSETENTPSLEGKKQAQTSAPAPSTPSAHGQSADEEEAEDEKNDAEDEVESEAKADISTDLQEEKSEHIDRNDMGKTNKLPSPEETFIQDIFISSTSSSVTHIIQQAHNQVYLPPLNQPQSIKHDLFPTHPLATSSSIFEYDFKPSGFSAQSYTICLPPDTSSFITMKISLHKLIHELKNAQIQNGQLLLNGGTEDDFLFKLLVNDDEVSNGGGIFEDKKNESNILTAQYDLKLTHGLNVLEFELKIAPIVSKKLKKFDLEKANEENTGRHTRHQLQQLKMNWDVERFTIYIISNNP